jgi:uncharacterized membrane protein YjjP (DUF1212 family)
MYITDRITRVRGKNGKDEYVIELKDDGAPSAVSTLVSELRDNAHKNATEDLRWLRANWPRILRLAFWLFMACTVVGYLFGQWMEAAAAIVLVVAIPIVGLILDRDPYGLD